ncbi:phage holin family protein [uncultured Brachybacterium sp.]|uniref:phage holin family protein n=1 Tax=uncultured Brachybacterium sp. TaxID=189680 RepID=UPI00262695EC|nr:phage holin family protein [uncultured Brachybacterium sp.]
MSSPVTPPPTDAERRAETESVGALMSQVTTDLSVLIRQEMALAKAEFTASAKEAGKGAGMFGGAGIAGHFVLLFLSIALWAAIGGTAVGYAWSAVIVALLWAIVAAVLALLGKKSIDEVDGMPRTTETLKDIPDAVTPSKESR